ncbi:hypothetical protein [Bacillus sp. FJAT-45350]|uniref:hypothetical protein n=1 Tax=Bacillus sp. FJAT-45350 TaxID=2011014 RepID=UPI00115518FE|nr:hypothetical protein [Bacillus sp. FJAT-45350]
MDAQTEQTKINTLLTLEATLGNELVVQNICDVLDIDYEEIKSKLPDPEADPMDDGTGDVIDGITVEDDV